MFDTLLKGSWRTTALGIVIAVQAIVGQVKNVLDSDPNTKFSLQEVTTAALAGWALLHARDNKVSSEAAGVK